MNFGVVVPKIASIASPLIHHPVPVQTANHFRWSTIPRKPVNISEFVGGKCDVASIANDVNDQRVRNRFLYAVQVQNVFWGSVGPALHPLFPAHFRHDDPQEISTISTLRHYFWGDFFLIEP